KRINPEMVQPLGIARRDVSRHAFVKAALREKTERSRKPFFAVAPLLGDRRKNRRARDSFHSRFYLGHKVLPAMFCLLYRIPGQCHDRFSCRRAEPPGAFAPRAKSETPPKLSEAPAQNKL